MAKTRKKNTREGDGRTARGKQIQKLKKRLKKNPADEEAFVQLWDIFLAAESWQAMVEILQARIAALDDPKNIVRALIRLGNLYDEKLSDPRSAVDTFHRVIAIDPENRRAIWSLAMLYHDLEDWEKVIEIYLLQIDLAQSPEEKLAIRAQLAQIYEQRLQQEDRALMEYIRAARLAPQNVRILLNMEKLATRTESFRELLAIYEDVVERIDRVELRIALYLKLARLYAERLGDETQAEGYYRRAVELSGTETERLFSISSIYGEEEEWQELISTYTQLIKYAKEPAAKSRLRREIARLYRDGLMDPASAFFEIVRVARYSPNEPGLLDEIYNLGVASEKHLELAAVLEDLGTRLDDERTAVELYTKLANLHLYELHNADLARGAVSKAIEIDPACVPAQLIRLDLLEYGKEFEPLAMALESFLSRPDLPPEVVKAQTKRLARILEEKLGDRERAVILYRESMQEHPQEAPPAEQREEILEDLYRRQGVWDELISLLTGRAEKTTDPDKLVGIALEIASIQEEKLDRSDLAFFELIRTVKQTPGHPRLIDELFRLAQSAGFANELLAVLDEQLVAMNQTAAARLQERAGLLLAESGMQAEAEDRFRRAIELDPSLDEAFRSLHTTLEEAQDQEGLVNLLLSRAAHISQSDPKIELLYEAAEILEEKIGNDGRAADVYDRILGLDPEAAAAVKAIKRLRGEAGQIATFLEEVTEDEQEAREEIDGRDAEKEEQAEEETIVETEEETEEETEAEEDEDEDVAEVISPLPVAEKEEDLHQTTGNDVANIFSPPPIEEDQIRTIDLDLEDPYRDREPTLVQGPPQEERSGGESTPSEIEEEEEEEEDKEPTLVGPVRGEAPAASEEEEIIEEEAAAAAEPEPEEEEPEEEEELDDAPMEEEATLPNIQSILEDPVDALWRAAHDEPDSLEAWDMLVARLQEDSGEEAAFEALENGISLTSSEKTKAKLYRRMSLMAGSATLQARLGQLLEEDGRPEDAESSYRSVLRQEPSSEEALDGLLRLYEERDDLTRYDAIITRTLKAASDPATRRKLLFRRASLRAERLDKSREALEDLDQLLAAENVDIEAIKLQESLYQKTGNYEQLVLAYERHISSCEQADDKAGLYSAMADVYEEHLDNQKKAVELYSLALAENPRDVDVHVALARLLQASRDWLGAIAALRRAAEQVEDLHLQSQMHFQVGKILEEQLLRPEEAEAAYHKATDNDFPALEAFSALRDMARRREDWVEVIRYGKKQAGIEADPIARAGILVEMATVWRDRLQNDEKALQCHEQAQELDPDNLQAARAVAEARLKTRSHEEAHNLLERVAKIGADSDMDAAELAAVHLKLAQTAEALDRPDDAAAAFERALELAPADLQILTQYGYHLARHDRWGQAVELYGKILDDYRHRLDPAEVADIHCLAAQGFVKLDQPGEAADQYRKALKANPRHLPALRASTALARKMGRHHEAADLLGQLLQLSQGPSTRFNLSVQLGDLLAGPLNRPEDAAPAYRQALEQEPNSIDLLEKLRKVLTRAEKYQEAIEVLQHLAHLAPNDRQRARFLRIAGDIERERLDDNDRALDFYLRALRHAPLDNRAHSSAVKILNMQRDWRRLGSLYEELLGRLPPPIAGQPDRRVPILSEMIDLFRYRLTDRKRAIKACEQLHAIMPADLKVREDLARLYESEGLHDKAVAIHRSLIADSPFSVDSYHALRRIYDHQGRRDRTLCLAATLAFLDEANDDEMALLKQHRHALPIPPGRRVDEALYDRLLLFPMARGLVGRMFSFISDYARPLFVRDQRDFHLKTRDRLDIDRSRAKITSIFREGLGLLGLPQPEIYGKGVSIKGILAVNTSPPAILFSEETVRRSSIAELRFMVGRAVAFTRPESLLAATLSPKQLRNLLDAMVETAFAGELVHADESVTRLARGLDKQIPKAKRNLLRQLADAYRKQAGDVSIRDWLEGIEHTCNRSGFLLSGDIEAAVQVLKGARVVSPSGSNRSLIRELIFYSISDDYFELRKALGAAIR